MTTNTWCLMFATEDDKKICVSTLLSHSNPTDITLRRNTNCFKLTDIVRNNFCNGLFLQFRWNTDDLFSYVSALLEYLIILSLPTTRWIIMIFHNNCIGSIPQLLSVCNLTDFLLVCYRLEVHFVFYEMITFIQIRSRQGVFIH